MLRLNRSVVVKAYNELKMDGLLDSRSRSGTYVISVRPEQQCHFVGRFSTILCKSAFQKHGYICLRPDSCRLAASTGTAGASVL
ncbi:hypothetical protein [Mesotoga sp.]|uniref:hypothetical protein n=1 Tax=Mesotoga sp. TaxID=2053577 RepID=UPI00261A2140|nr:hypothetical protein [Mesotoga sp.]